MLITFFVLSKNEYDSQMNCLELISFFGDILRHHINENETTINICNVVNKRNVAFNFFLKERFIKIFYFLSIYGIIE